MFRMTLGVSRGWRRRVENAIARQTVDTNASKNDAGSDAGDDSNEKDTDTISDKSDTVKEADKSLDLWADFE